LMLAESFLCLERWVSYVLKEHTSVSAHFSQPHIQLFWALEVLATGHTRGLHPGNARIVREIVLFKKREYCRN